MNSDYYGNLIKKIKKLNLRVKESAIFLKRFVKKPRQIGSVTPSSRFLTRAVMSKIKWDDASSIAELGAGTGVFTRAIVRNLKPDGKLFVFELDPTMKNMIKNEHPDLAVYDDATELHRIICEQGVGRLDYVVSSLPFAVLPPRVSVAVVDAVNKSLKPGGKFIAYQYSKSMKNHFEKRFESVKMSFVWRNVPPAFVYECTKAAEDAEERRTRKDV